MLKIIEKLTSVMTVILTFLLVTRFFIQNLNHYAGFDISWFCLENMPHSFTVVIILFMICVVMNSIFKNSDEKG